MTPPQRKRRHPRPEPPPPPLVLPTAGDQEGEEKNPERLYVIAGGADGGRAELDLVTLIVARADPPPSIAPEQAALLRLCTSPLSVAELSAYLNLPFSVVTVLITELITAELVQARAPIVRQALPDRSILEAVMHGLQKL
ncbi:DUF742 domain-containing protein [Streptomyces sp. HUAS TT20]|jgi:uncharacterized protein DUF742|uniref:DUF742 domain-containing protein n=1 Tax=Streptomyces sp. HUAS TT20 TaxID=3447509 RepID=UPI0021D89CFB|nr:DUF742 domain-containing protein [Streptomyces sp. HUAS 15-9]UXY26535.1 DUF742 domain-containing protein [Streptomyces sp. HUAS 15-9]